MKSRAFELISFELIVLRVVIFTNVVGGVPAVAHGVSRSGVVAVVGTSNSCLRFGCYGVTSIVTVLDKIKRQDTLDILGRCCVLCLGRHSWTLKMCSVVSKLGSEDVVRSRCVHKTECAES